MADWQVLLTQNYGPNQTYQPLLESTCIAIVRGRSLLVFNLTPEEPDCKCDSCLL